MLRLIPSGMLHPGKTCFIGNGVVLSPEALLKEIDELQAAGIDVASRLKISEACPLILPYHIALDKAREAAKGENKIGTTGRGIGPTTRRQGGPSRHPRAGFVLPRAFCRQAGRKPGLL